jgi:D-sedoheptulose 7-phosphate isomerase
MNDKYITNLIEVLNVVDQRQIDDAVDLIKEKWLKGRNVFTIGNGGSALTAQHFVNDWSKSISLSSENKFKGRALVDNVGLVLSYANDISYGSIFAEQLKVYGEAQDLLIAISGSGNSENIINAVKYAKDHEIDTLGLCGFDGGLLKPLCDNVLWAEVNDMQIVEDVHMIFGHLVMQRLCNIHH